MLSEYEAAMLTKQKSADSAFAHAAPARNRIVAVLLALSVLSAVGLLYTAFFHRGPVSAAAQAVPATTGASHIIQPAASGVPEAALFLRHRPGGEDTHDSELVQAAVHMAASAR
jgi:hypothetical protein